MQHWFIALFFDIGHPCYGQMTPVKTKYLLTRIKWSYHGLKFRTHQGHVLFLKSTPDQVLVFFYWIAGSWCKQGQVVSNQGLKVKQSINFLVHMFFHCFSFEHFETVQTQNRRPNNLQKTSPQSSKLK